MKKIISLIQYAVSCIKEYFITKKFAYKEDVCNEKKDRGLMRNANKKSDIMTKVMEFLSSHYEFRYNIISEQTEFRPINVTDAVFHPVTQRELNSICIDMQRNGIVCWDKDLLRYVNSTKIADYHPFRLYMDELPKWDGIDRVSELARRVSDDESWVNDFHRWMLGMTAQWLGVTGNHANSVAPILISCEQGKLKSTFCKSLLPDQLKGYYTDSFDLTSQNGCERKMAEMGLINLDEFDKFPKSRMSQLKNIMQTVTLNMRKAYQKNFRQLPRIASFIATSNRVDLLTDTSGSRRFICVEVKGKIDCENIAHKQIYAQLKSEIAQGQHYWFSEEEEKSLQKRNASYNRNPASIDLFQTVFRAARDGENAARLSLAEIMTKLEKTNKTIMKNADPQQLGRDIIACGIKRIHTKFGNRYMVMPL